MSLILHTGAEAIDYDGLRDCEVPEATATHVPIPHHSVVDMVKYALGYYGHDVTEEHYGITPDGARVFVCDNLAFVGDHVIKRKHTANAKRDLPGLVAQVIEPLGAKRQDQALTFQRYQETPLIQHQADAAIMQLYRENVINVTRIADVLDAYEDPPCDWGEPTAWRLFNATTYALTGRVTENPDATRRLHRVIDGVCEAA